MTVGLTCPACEEAANKKPELSRGNEEPQNVNPEMINPTML